MLRRLPEIHKRQACAMVPNMTKGVSAVDLCENTLYGLPHDDFRPDKQKWPTNQLVEQWRALKYVSKAQNRTTMIVIYRPTALIHPLTLCVHYSFTTVATVLLYLS
jgi:hypothetical protein